MRIVRSHVQVAVLAASCNVAAPAGCKIQLEDRLLTLVSGSEIDALRIRRPHELIDPTIEIVHGQCNFLRCTVVESEPEAVALITRARLRPPGDVLAIGRVGRTEVASGAG